MTGVSECSQQRGNLRDNGYIRLQFGDCPKEMKVGFGEQCFY
ncbi:MULTISPECIES: hypothetical protein [Photorhabdus]|nr:hypothetical protein [Photorhabdus sp. RW14-46]